MNRRIQLLALALLSLVFTSCINSSEKGLAKSQNIGNSQITNDTSPDFQVRFSNHTGWTFNQNIYEVNIRQYTPEGTFKAFETHLPRLHEMGVGILWIMPVHPIGEVNRKGTLGSYYSVKDYTAVNTEFGNLSDFKSMVHNAHEADMHVIIDWVANHTSWDNVLTVTHPDYFLKTTEGSFQPPLGHEDWTDVIQLDYSNLELQDYMIQTLKNWVVETGIDGFRFDYVDGVPIEFWKRAIKELKDLKPDIFLMAEGDGSKYHTMGFDMDYCWALHGWDRGIMRQIYEGKKKVYHLNEFLNAEKLNYMPNNYHMYFTSNHDENSWHGTEFKQLGVSSEVFAVLTQTLYGMPLIYNGQEAGMDKQLKFFDKDTIQWNNLPYSHSYGKLNNLHAKNSALWNGNAGGIPIRINTSLDDSVFAFSRTKDNNQVLVFLNLTPNPLTFKLLDEISMETYQDLFSEKAVEINKQKAITLKGWGYQVLVK